ncbi:J domain-containing protein [Methylocystis sp. S23]
MLLPAAAAALISAGLTLLILLALHVTAAWEFAPLSTTDDAMRGYAEAGYFPLQAAAETEGRHALATGVNLQTFGGLLVMVMSGAYGAWRGFSSPRARGWSNAFWMTSVVAICLALSAFHGLTPQMLDYFIGSDGPGVPAPPTLVLVKRGLYAAGLSAFLCVFAHDLGYRLRESLVDFGLIEEDEARAERRERPRSFKDKGRPRADKEPPREEGGFGQREMPRSWTAPTSEEARARAVLGVGAGASRREIERAYRSQMKRAHPDHGGSVERAAALNAARDLLLGRRQA